MEFAAVYHRPRSEFAHAVEEGRFVFRLRAAHGMLKGCALHYTDRAPLTVTPAPDSVLRVFMAWQALEEPVELPEQELPAFQRQGFTLVEWGGAEITK